MNGLYIHIPFCKKRCVYCDFYSTTLGAIERRRYVDCLVREMELRKDYLPSAKLDTIYIGGGTPSQLSVPELGEIYNAVFRIFSVSSEAEVTLEVNPDDVTADYVRALKELPVNRISMGVQTLHDELLRLLNRRHTAEEARDAIKTLQNADFQNLSVDLIYGLPKETLEEWASDVDEILCLGVPHLSAYALIYEEGTPLWKMRDEKKVEEASEDLSLQMFRLLMDKTEEAGLEHYEISNFARPGYKAKHNSGYWQEMNYLGLGPAAHSYNGASRQWNVADLGRYLQAGGDVLAGKLFELEELTPQMKFEEMILKSLRTAEGLDLNRLACLFGKDKKEKVLQSAQPFITRGQLKLSEDGKKLRLTRNGIFVSDGIMSEVI